MHQPPPPPEVLPPRNRKGRGIFDDENLDILSHILDDFIQIPGTSIRFGLDGIVGLIPGIGDVIGGIASCIIIIAAWARGVPYVVLARMVTNIVIEVGIGTIPVVGDAFDIAWRANRRNYALLTGSLYQPRKHTVQSWIFLLFLCVTLIALMLLPMLLIAWLANGLMHTMFGVEVHFPKWF
ncbi:DUF4112 domain-containing protein [Edaphobacter albus]|uniref:DUF4112 domain-containing protein n=1 Tax=Edaphobacter sp. 4G125 TaxID=2763071 RepID=UPI001647745C|nr:DUF4112 domain-containing protein [Edaphobacter sp. 4G125]QNI37469.1 DUF4112 domain-containing protein [Edaphobacter sp. 4G125]